MFKKEIEFTINDDDGYWLITFNLPHLSFINIVYYASFEFVEKNLLKNKFPIDYIEFQRKEYEKSNNFRRYFSFSREIIGSKILWNELDSNCPKVEVEKILISLLKNRVFL